MSPPADLPAERPGDAVPDDPHAAGPGRADDAERIRSCLACGELVPYHERTCPSCGHYDPLASAGVGQPSAAAEAPCPSCGISIPARLVFCPRCGRERGLQLPVATQPRPTPRAGSAGLDALALLLTLLGPLALLAAVLIVYLD